MIPPIPHTIHNTTLWLCSERAIYWEAEQTLIISDAHFGKTGHFRKSGIAVPQAVYKEDLHRLVQVLHHFNPKQLLVVGDFFHSDVNAELDLFRKWREGFSGLDILLVKGNHDILKDEWYRNAGIRICEDDHRIHNFVFTHHHCGAEEDSYTFCGHIHPGIIINGMGRQTLRFPCFYFAEDHCIIPAFSRFTGLALVDAASARDVYAIVDKTLVKI